MTVIAPEARRNTARSGAKRNSGELSTNSSNPWQGVADRVASKVTLVKWQTMRLQQNLEFLEERNASMMFFLPLDVPVHFGQHRLAHRECAISFLPRKPRAVLECSRDPAGRVSLQLPDEFRDRLVRPKFCQDVNVVGSSVDDQRDSVFVPDCTAEVLMRSGAHFWRQPGFAPLRREDDVIEQIAIGGTHSDADFRRPYSGAWFFLDYTRSSASLHSGLNSAAPSGCLTGWPRMLDGARRMESVPEGRKNTSQRFTSGFDSGGPCGCFRAVGVSHSAPEARRNTARSGAKRNSGDLSTKFSNPWQGVAELRFAKGSTK